MTLPLALTYRPCVGDVVCVTRGTMPGTTPYVGSLGRVTDVGVPSKTGHTVVMYMAVAGRGVPVQYRPDELEHR